MKTEEIIKLAKTLDLIGYEIVEFGKGYTQTIEGGQLMERDNGRRLINLVIQHLEQE